VNGHFWSRCSWKTSTLRLILRTSASYETYLKKFAILIHQEYESKMRFPPEWLCDDIVAYLLSLVRFASRKYGWKPHHKKAALWTLGETLIYFCMRQCRRRCHHSGTRHQAQNNSRCSTIHSRIQRRCG
jgi:hypothetical protein